MVPAAVLFVLLPRCGREPTQFGLNLPLTSVLTARTCLRTRSCIPIICHKFFLLNQTFWNTSIRENMEEMLGDLCFDTIKESIKNKVEAFSLVPFWAVQINPEWAHRRTIRRKDMFWASYEEEGWVLWRGVHSIRKSVRSSGMKRPVLKLLTGDLFARQLYFLGRQIFLTIFPNLFLFLSQTQENKKNVFWKNIFEKTEPYL